MDDKQTRWFCEGCKREWLTHSDSAHGALEIDYSIKPEPQAVAWNSKHGCPFCRHAAIRLVTFTPAFPGGDIPRPTTIDVPVAPPPPAPIIVPERRNRTLYDASPELE